MTGEKIHVLLVEDNPGDARLVIGILEHDESGAFTVKHVATLAEAMLSLAPGCANQVILLDLGLPDSSGLHTLQRIMPLARDATVVVMTAIQDEELGIAAIREGAHDYLIKGQVHGGQLRRVLRYAVERHKMQSELRAEMERRTQAQQALQLSEQRYRLLSETAPISILITDELGRVVHANAQAVRMFGYGPEELVGQTVETLIPDRFRKTHQGHRALYADKPHPRAMGIGMDLWARRKDGSEFPVEVGFGPLATPDGLFVSSAIVDITERKKMEDQLRVAQRMEAIGALAGGVAHDFNNLLGVILGQSEILLERSTDSRLIRGLEMIRESARRGATLTRQLLAFSRRQILELKVLDLNVVLSDVVKLLQRVIGEDIELDVQTDTKIGSIRADPGQLEQIVVNLAANARDAMPAGGKLTITTANADLDEVYSNRRVVVRPGRYVQLVVSDTGCGMDRETQSRIFEPFFTTKEQGKGTGLGLATVYGIVKQSGGYIWVYSEPGHGTAFKIYLPMVEAAAESPRPVEKSEELERGSETILVVEDDAALREVTCEFLQSSGYTVIAAESPEEALRLAERQNGTIHFLLTDVVLPRMNGRELAARLTAARPGMKVLYVSGYTDGIVRDGVHGALEEGLAFLQKPCTRHALTRKVREILDAPQAQPVSRDR
ncbi:MAG TPA: response regulator [Candidatus Angelobacter sp.]|nr:response regulator [Candidatus Angelobacter sp.]